MKHIQTKINISGLMNNMICIYNDYLSDVLKKLFRDVEYLKVLYKKILSSWYDKRDLEISVLEEISKIMKHACELDEVHSKKDYSIITKDFSLPVNLRDTLISLNLLLPTELVSPYFLIEYCRILELFNETIRRKYLNLDVDLNDKYEDVLTYFEVFFKGTVDLN